MKKALIGTAALMLLQASMAWAQAAVVAPPGAGVPPTPVMTAATNPYPYRTDSDNGTVRSFNPATGKLTLQDGATYWVPKSFALPNMPEVGQPITIYYRVDPGRRIVQSVEMGQVERS